MALPKWTDERTAQLTEFVGDESPVSQATVAEAADNLETSTRSVSSKLRKMGYEVELASAASSRTFSEEQEATLSAFVSDNMLAYSTACGACCCSSENISRASSENIAPMQESRPTADRLAQMSARSLIFAALSRKTFR